MYHFYGFPILPVELSIKIYNYTKNNAVDIIIKYWYRYINKKVRIIYLVIEFNNIYRNDYSPNIMHYINNINSFNII